MPGAIEKDMKRNDRLVRLHRHERLILGVALLLDLILPWFVLKQHQQGTLLLYVDPGSGLLLWQLLVAAGAGFVFNVGRRIARIFNYERFRQKN